MLVSFAQREYNEMNSRSASTIRTILSTYTNGNTWPQFSSNTFLKVGGSCRDRNSNIANAWCLYSTKYLRLKLLNTHFDLSFYFNVDKSQRLCLFLLYPFRASYWHSTFSIRGNWSKYEWACWIITNQQMDNVSAFTIKPALILQKL